MRATCRRSGLKRRWKIVSKSDGSAMDMVDAGRAVRSWKQGPSAAEPVLPNDREASGCFYYAWRAPETRTSVTRQHVAQAQVEAHLESQGRLSITYNDARAGAFP